jgi:NCS1 family nucleobase:cation symporter-1
MSKVSSIENPVEVGGEYRERVLTVEPHGIEQVPASERHGRPRASFTLWLSANMGLPVWLVGALAIVLGLGFADSVIAILVGNLIGCGLLALTASMGPEIGMPQLSFTRHSFGLRGAYLPALLNWVSASGWYAVNSIVGSLAIVRLTTLPFWVSLLVLTMAQMLLAIIFLLMSVIGLPQAHFGLPSTLPLAEHIGLFVLTTTAVASYVFSWSPYASDYARYLPKDTSKWRVFGAVFAGSFIGCVWLQVLGAAVATIGLNLAPIDLVVKVMGPLWVPALLAVILGTIAANALNIYTGALSLLTLDVPIKRWISVIAVGVLGGLLALYGSSGLSGKYENFLLLISYWIGPWLAIVFVDFFLHPGQAMRPDGLATSFRRAIEWPGMVAFLVGLAVSIPFMNSSLYAGPMANLLHGADIAYYVGMLVAGVLYSVLRLQERTMNRPNRRNNDELSHDCWRIALSLSCWPHRLYESEYAGRPGAPGPNGSSSVQCSLCNPYGHQDRVFSCDLHCRRALLLCCHERRKGPE